MKYDIIPFHDNYGINKNGEVINFSTNKILNSIIMNNEKYVYIDKIPYRVMELLVKTYITLYDDFNWDYFDKNPNNVCLNNVWITIKNIHKKSDTILIIDNHEYMSIPEYPKYYISNNGTVFSTKKCIFMKKKYDVGYPCISFPIENRKSKIYKIHRLVFCTWSNISSNNVEVVHHKDNRKYNSNLENLENSTMFDNTRYAILDGQKTVKFSLSDIECMCKLYNDGVSYREISNIIFNSDKFYSEIRNMIYRIKLGMAYKDLKEKYNLSDDDIPSKKKLNSNQVHQICRKLELGQSCNSISKEFNTSPNTIYMIRDRKRWKSISQHYSF